MAHWEVVDNVISVDFRAKREQEQLMSALEAVVNELQQLGFADNLELILDPIPYEAPESDPA